jgi:hypothetical protein
MRANRLLGAQLVEQNLVKIWDLEVVNERLRELVVGKSPGQSTVRGVLAYEKKVVKDDMLTHLADVEGSGLSGTDREVEPFMIFRRCSASARNAGCGVWASSAGSSTPRKDA